MSKHGVVIGGGIGGLLAAHVLAGCYERVTVLERNRYPGGSKAPAPPSRGGAPQSRCLHLLTAAGAAAFDEVAAGWRHELVAGGAIPFDASADSRMRVQAGWLPRMRSGIILYACSRALIEHALRRGLASKPNVAVREGRGVVGLLSRQPDGAVTGVQLTDQHGDGQTAILADLVVDATGAGSTLPRWLARLPNVGGLQVETTVIASGMDYVSRWFHLEPKDAPDWLCLSVAPTSDSAARGAMMLRAEKDCWGVVLLAPVGEPLPADDVEFNEFTADLGDGVLRNALSRARPVSPIHRYWPTTNRMCHYGRFAAWPAGLVALGDSVCALDPYFGLGMTATARSAALLRTWLSRQAYGPISSREFQNELAALNIAPWRLATGRDPDGSIRAQNAIDIHRLYEAAPSNPRIARALLDVHHMLRPAESLMEFRYA